MFIENCFLNFQWKKWCARQPAREAQIDFCSISNCGWKGKQVQILHELVTVIRKFMTSWMKLQKSALVADFVRKWFKSQPSLIDKVDSNWLGWYILEHYVQECIPIDQPGDLPVAVHGIPKPRGTGCTKKWFAVKRSKLVFCAFYIVWI